MQKKYKSLFSNTIIFAIASLGSKFILFFLLPLYTNTLTTSEYGISDLLVTSANLIIPFITLSINDSILRFGLDKNINSGQVFKNTCLILLGSTALMLALYPFVGLFKPWASWVGYFVLITILQMFRSSFSLYLKSIDKIKIFALDSILYTFLLATGSIVLLLILKMGLNGYFIAMIFAMSVSLIFQIIAGKLYGYFINSNVNKDLLKKMLVYSIPLITNAASWWVINFSDRFMLNYFRTEVEVGLYSVASKIPSLVTTFSSVFLQAWVISSITEYDEKRDKGFYKRVFSIYSLFLVLTASTFMIIVKPFMSFYVGNDFMGSWKAVPYLLLGAIFYSYSPFFTAIYKSAKKNIREMTATLINAILNILLNLFLVPKYGLMGAVMATMIANLAVSMYCIFDSRRFFSFFIDFKILYFNFLILIIQCVVVSMDFHPVGVSLISVCLLLIVNYNNVISLFITLKKLLLKQRSLEK
ncbi:hypothetical protein PAECIP111891_07100 [Paenibacillus allorhizoplanae]|uniref:Polysaccharide biosynthesis protein C-terminal domain-containing protein n=1 Tax=Paenibacillus allorhizoplanae TaxID=2905648 RepID=A0ABM9CZJ9_9BACL|nr:polysaccharide biosynthesis C-terminal domain-containing protein [Paenibacillus allorhizoplanae]CAH1232810.1 hypothetical protein PAECIP111891_07100 [Paenibacillus allorhizoplanae]